jgi:hypothetical protein
VGLTTQQKARFLRAYRDTFTAENHGDAVKELYARFSELYGISADDLGSIVSNELKSNPRQYSTLRRELAARRATTKGQEKPRRTASVKKPQAKAKAKSRAKAQVKSAKRRLTCPVCQQSVVVLDNGCVKGHNTRRINGLVWCRGSGLKIAAPQTTDRRPDDRSSSSSVHTVRGGLPG